MHVDRAVLRYGQNLVRQDLSVRHNDENIRPEALNLLQSRAVAHFSRLEHRDTRLQRQFLDRAGRELHAAIFGLIRLCEYADHIKPLIQQTAERDFSKVRRAHEHDPHPAQSSACCSSSGSSIRMAFVVNSLPSRWSNSWQKARAVSPSPSTSKKLP